MALKVQSQDATNIIGFQLHGEVPPARLRDATYGRSNLNTTFQFGLEDDAAFANCTLESMFSLPSQGLDGPNLESC